MRRPLPLFVSVTAVVLLAACGSTTPEPSGTASGTASRDASPTASPTETAPTRVEGTVVRFTGGGTSVDVTIGAETPTTRDFLSLLPLTMELEELNGREKIGYPPRELDVDGTPGSDPENGDLIYFTPWGNIGFYYNADGIEYSDQTLHLGTYEAGRDQLDQLASGEVSIEVVDS
ncbi:cyclophilin-like fold protein [Promicromonospora sp. NPDC023805]|uniref:cyclophilin-like fold protein n=1 Tax=Promicromonospora sp. NPDC023805 TaxID=3154696 RepID=UPI0034011597